MFMPAAFFKAKRTLTKIIAQYFVRLKDEFSNKGGSIYLKK